MVLVTMSPQEQRSPVATGEPAEIRVFDRAGLLNRVMQDEVLARRLIAQFLEDLPGQIRQLQTYAAAGEPERVREQAHQLKGACAVVSGEALRALAVVLEKAGNAGAPSHDHGPASGSGRPIYEERQRREDEARRNRWLQTEYPEKKAQALIADGNYAALDQLVIEHLLGKQAGALRRRLRTGPDSVD